jgi:oligosaccharide repeat unit polymerase
MEMYLLNVFIGFALLAWSWFTFRDELHPQFLTTVALFVMFFLNFITTGYEDVAIVGVPGGEMPGYQATIMFVCVAIVALSMLISRLFPLPADRSRAAVIARSTSHSERAFLLYASIAWAIVLVEILKRLYLSGWSVPSAVIYSLAPRGMTPWGGQGSNLGNENFFYNIVKIVLPFAGLLLAYLIAHQKGMKRTISSVGFGVVMLLMITYGSRTPVVASLVGLALFLLYRPVSRIRKIVTTTGIFALTAVIVTTMFLFRSYGFLGAYEAGLEYEAKYHQDNNYYSTLRALHIASSTSERLEPVKFAVTTAVNPIPRAFWPGKPALQADYFGNYKQEWETISFLGEWTAMFGPGAGPLLAVLCGVLIFLFMRESTRTLRWPGGLIVYMILILYSYMVMRSMQNAVNNAYLPAFAFLVYWMAFRKPGRSPLRPMGQSTSPHHPASTLAVR